MSNPPETTYSGHGPEGRAVACGQLRTTIVCMVLHDCMGEVWQML